MLAAALAVAGASAEAATLTIAYDGLETTRPFDGDLSVPCCNGGQIDYSLSVFVPGDAGLVALFAGAPQITLVYRESAGTTQERTINGTAVSEDTFAFSGLSRAREEFSLTISAALQIIGASYTVYDGADRLRSELAFGDTVSTEFGTHFAPIGTFTVSADFPPTLPIPIPAPASAVMLVLGLFGLRMHRVSK